MFAIVVFLFAFMEGIKAGAVGVLIGLAVGVGTSVVFYSGVAILLGWVSRRLNFSKTTFQQRCSMIAGWILAIALFAWLILSASCAFWLTRLLLRMK